MVSTNYSSPVSPESENYHKSIATKDVLLLEGGYELLLENGTYSILLEYTDIKSTNFAKTTINSTNYST